MVGAEGFPPGVVGDLAEGGEQIHPSFVGRGWDGAMDGDVSPLALDLNHAIKGPVDDRSY
ncbi:MAG TPA: hypothetical protein VMV23_04115 [Candidatus Nanopelagicaceae bacterium]|nr:hypothetical protein [Candidatus Nanopelagicaceae bacterium]